MNRTDRTTLNVADHHAHLLIAEAGGRIIKESPEEVMTEVEFRATHLSSLMEDMLKETKEREWLEGE